MKLKEIARKAAKHSPIQIHFMDMTQEQYEAFRTRMNLLFCGAVIIAGSVAALFAAIKIANYFMGV